MSSSDRWGRCWLRYWRLRPLSVNDSIEKQSRQSGFHGGRKETTRATFRLQPNISPSTRTTEYYRSLLSYGYFEVLKAFSHWLFQNLHLSCTACAPSTSARLWAVSDLELLPASRYDLHNPDWHRQMRCVPRQYSSRSWFFYSRRQASMTSWPSVFRLACITARRRDPDSDLSP